MVTYQNVHFIIILKRTYPILKLSYVVLQGSLASQPRCLFYGYLEKVFEKAGALGSSTTQYMRMVSGLFLQS